jgi:hypothetical protein
MIRKVMRYKRESKKIITADHSGDMWNFCELEAVADSTADRETLSSFLESLEGEMHAYGIDFGYTSEEIDREVERATQKVQAVLERRENLAEVTYFNEGGPAAAVPAKPRVSLERIQPPSGKALHIKYEGKKIFRPDFTGFEITRENCKQLMTEAYVDEDEVVTTCKISHRGRPIALREIYEKFSSRTPDEFDEETIGRLERP